MNFEGGLKITKARSASWRDASHAYNNVPSGHTNSPSAFVIVVWLGGGLDRAKEVFDKTFF